MMRTEKVIAIHQPNFLPWLGYFAKMSQAHAFVLLDTVPYTKNSFQNRVKVNTAQGPQWLTIPVMTKGRFGQLTADVQVKNEINWRKAHLMTITTNYSRAPFFNEVMNWLEPCYQFETGLMAPFCQNLIEAIVQQLHIETELVLASTLQATSSATEHLRDLVVQTGGGVYLSGPSGRNYLEPELFEAAGIEIRYVEFEHPTYPHLYGEFTPGLSTLDLLMNVGSQEATRLINH